MHPPAVTGVDLGARPASAACRLASVTRRTPEPGREATDVMQMPVPRSGPDMAGLTAAFQDGPIQTSIILCRREGGQQTLPSDRLLPLAAVGCLGRNQANPQPQFRRGLPALDPASHDPTSCSCSLCCRNRFSSKTCTTPLRHGCSSQTRSPRCKGRKTCKDGAEYHWPMSCTWPRVPRPGPLWPRLHGNGYGLVAASHHRGGRLRGHH